MRRISKAEVMAALERGECWCSKCQSFKPQDDFYFDSRTKTGRMSYCKVHHRELVYRTRRKKRKRRKAA
jgi:hypothetical protein